MENVNLRSYCELIAKSVNLTEYPYQLYIFDSNDNNVLNDALDVYNSLSDADKMVIEFNEDGFITTSDLDSLQKAADFFLNLGYLVSLPALFISDFDSDYDEDTETEYSNLKVLFLGNQNEEDATAFVDTANDGLYDFFTAFLVFQKKDNVISSELMHFEEGSCIPPCPPRVSSLDADFFDKEMTKHFVELAEDCFK